MNTSVVVLCFIIYFFVSCTWSDRNVQGQKKNKKAIFLT